MLDSFIEWLTTAPPSPTALLQALGTPLIGIVGAVIAYQNARTARNKLKFDMFDKRAEVYRDVSEVFLAAGISGTLTGQQADQIRSAAGKAKFLFANKEIDELLKTAVSQAHSLVYFTPPLRPTTLDGKPPVLGQDLISVRRNILRQARIDVEAKGGKLDEAPDPKRLWFPPSAWYFNRIETWDRLTGPYLRLEH